VRLDGEHAAAGRDYLDPVLAPSELGAGDDRAPERADVLVGVHGGPDAESAAEAVERVRETLAPLARDRTTAVLVLGSGHSRRAHAEAHGATPPPESQRLPAGAGPLAALLAAAESLDAKACALVSADPRDGDGEYLADLLGPILRDGYDLVWPLYRRHKFEGGLHAALARPFTRALFGTGLRQPITPELAFSRQAAPHLGDDRALHEDTGSGTESLLAAHGVARDFLARGFKVGQAIVGSVPAAGPGGDVSDMVARIAGLLFDEARRYAAEWQRVRGTVVVPIVGGSSAYRDEPRPLDPQHMFDGFAQGYRELHRLWGPVLPPATLLALKRAASQAAASFRLDPALWARVVYDFAVGHRTGAMERKQLLRSMTPLYLGWMASWVNTVRDARADEVDARADEVCRAFEAEKPYFISRWRWPDRFAP
jgi:hypothetical protein